jgi:hypothetical protein
MSLLTGNRASFRAGLTLPADIGELLVPYLFGNRAERRPRFDRLELFCIADQHHVGTALRAPLGKSALRLSTRWSTGVR